MSQINLEQKHLNKIDTINYGSYYTPKLYVDIAYNLISKYTNIENYTILDTSCGYGNFLRYKNSIGADIDKIAVKKAKQNTNCFILEQNALLNVTRKNYNISDTQKLIIVGNPPYNDTTSIINNSIKQTKFDIDKDLRHRDLGISFLLSYNKLYANYICILHPLSYLIKKTNFNGLRNFTENYKLIDNIIISSNSFSDTSKITAFPIVIALYKRDNNGMTFEYIKKYKFAITVHHTFIFCKDGKKSTNSPEGIHQDGMDFIMSAFVIDKKNINGAKSIIYANDKKTKIFETILKNG